MIDELIERDVLATSKEKMTSMVKLTLLPPHYPQEATAIPPPRTLQLYVCVFRPLCIIAAFRIFVGRVKGEKEREEQERRSGAAERRG